MEFLAGYLALCREDAGRREHSLRGSSMCMAIPCAPATSDAYAGRSAAMRDRLPADATLVTCRRLPSNGGRFAVIYARVCRAAAATWCNDRRQSQKMRRPDIAFNSRCSSMPRPNAPTFFCRAWPGSLKRALPGRQVFDASRKTTNNYPKPWQLSIFRLHVPHARPNFQSSQPKFITAYS